MRSDYICFVSNARIPGNNSLAEAHQTISIGIVVDYKTGEIKDCSTTYISPVITDFVQNLIVGFNLHTDDADSLIEDIEFAFNAPTKKALCVGLRSNFDKYKIWRREHGLD